MHVTGLQPNTYEAELVNKINVHVFVVETIVYRQLIINDL